MIRLLQYNAQPLDDENLEVEARAFGHDTIMCTLKKFKSSPAEINLLFSQSVTLNGREYSAKQLAVYFHRIQERYNILSQRLPDYLDSQQRDKAAELTKKLGKLAFLSKVVQLNQLLSHRADTPESISWSCWLKYNASDQPYWAMLSENQQELLYFTSPQSPGRSQPIGKIPITNCTLQVYYHFPQKFTLVRPHHEMQGRKKLLVFPKIYYKSSLQLL
jgi:hypothetical protein